MTYDFTAYNELAVLLRDVDDLRRKLEAVGITQADDAVARRLIDEAIVDMIGARSSLLACRVRVDPRNKKAGE